MGRPEGVAAARLLWVLRHAAAVADPPRGGADHDRELTSAGRRDAEALGRRLTSDRLGFAPGDLPSVVLCSTARRTTQTAETALAGVPSSVDRRRRLYYASPEEVLEEVRTMDDDVRSVMVVGHNPAVHQLSLAMIADEDEAGRRSLEGGKFPACGLTVYRLAAPRWRDVAPGTGTLVGRFAPPYAA